MRTKTLVSFSGYIIIDTVDEDEAYAIASYTLNDVVDYFQIHDVSNHEH